MGANVTNQQRGGWFRRRRGEHAEQRALTRETLPDVMFPDSPSGSTVTTRNAWGAADVFACVRVLSLTASTLPLHAYRRAASGRQRVAAPLLDSPAPGVTQSSFIAQAVLHLALWGEVFVGAFAAGDELAFLSCLAPDQVDVRVGRDGEPLYIWTPPGGKSGPRELDRGDVMHARMTSLDGVRGASPIAVCRDALGLSRSLSTHASKAAAGGFRPDGVVSIGGYGPEAEETAQKTQEAWEKRHAAPGRTAFVTGEVTYTAVSSPARDVELVAQRQLSTVEVCRIFGVQPWMIAAPAGDSMTYANTESQAQAFVTFALSPYLVALEQAVSAYEGPLLPAGDTYVQFERGALLQPDHAGRAAFYAAALDPAKGWMRRDEVRALEDLPAESETT